MQLLQIVENVTRLIDVVNSIEVDYLDFRKAFDSVPHVPHEILFKKKKSYGI